MNPWLHFVLWLVSVLIAAGLGVWYGYTKGRLDEFREWGTRKDED